MNRLVYLPLVGIVALAAYALWPLLRPHEFVTEADNAGLQETEVAIGYALLTAVAPTETAYVTSTPTKTPKPATSTPQSTYGPDASPGQFIVPAWTETPVVASTIDPNEQPPCETVTPKPYADQSCWVGAP